MFFNLPGSAINLIKKEISEACDGTEEIKNLLRHTDYMDADKIFKLFDIKENEKKLENGWLNAVYSRLALKNI